jgi:Fe-S oxidoreductase
LCPSYQATREEQNSTRGRANLLRALIAQPSSIQNQKSEIIDSAYSALDLCLACKGCKAECPSGVDMAKLKFEFENEYYKTHHRPLRDYVFGYFHVIAKMASAIAPLSNAVMNIPLFKNLTAKVFGVTTKRPFPKFINKQSRITTTESTRKIIFISDPFARYIEPEVEQAAFDVLIMSGYDVQVAPIIGAGASLLSKGFLDAAKRHAEKMIDALNQIDPKREATIVGIEPPEMYCLKNDYLDLLPHRKDEIASLSARTWLLEEYLLRSENFSALRVGNIANKFTLNRMKGDVRKVLFQPHCHQRAEGLADDGLPSGANATAELLRLSGYDVEILDTGCCGMAGTFGYEAEHYELSQQVGELKLFPMLRRYPSATMSKIEDQSSTIVSTGAACRMQIRQGVDMDVVHPILLVKNVLLRDRET